MRDIILNNFAKIKLWFKGSKEQSIDSRQELENDREKRKEFARKLNARLLSSIPYGIAAEVFSVNTFINFISLSFKWKLLITIGYILVAFIVGPLELLNFSKNFKKKD